MKTKPFCTCCCFTRAPACDCRTTDLLRRFVSPIFFSTREDGTVVRGLGALPPDRPILFVGNHQFYALDIGILIEEFLRKKDMLPRGLAHPVIFGVSIKDRARCFLA